MFLTANMMNYILRNAIANNFEINYMCSKWYKFGVIALKTENHGRILIHVVLWL